MWQRHLQQAWKTGKKTIGSMWHHTVKFASQLDHGFNVGKRILSSIDPLLQDLGAGNVSRAAVQGFGKYEQGRDQAMGYHNNVMANLSRLRRDVPELGLDN